jgi:hypothetical protein
VAVVVIRKCEGGFYTWFASHLRVGISRGADVFGDCFGAEKVSTELFKDDWHLT